MSMNISVGEPGPLSQVLVCDQNRTKRTSEDNPVGASNLLGFRESTSNLAASRPVLPAVKNPWRVRKDQTSRPRICHPSGRQAES
jgi:hypothetical protein